MARWVGRGRFRPLPPVVATGNLSSDQTCRRDGVMNPIARRALLLAAAAAATLAFSGCVGRPLPSEFDQVAPAINGENVVWEDSRNDETAGTDIYAFNTGTLAESLVAGGAGEQDQPAISDRYIVWIDEGRLRAKDLSSGQVFSVTNGAATQADPFVCGSVVVWSDTANNSDVYAKNLAGGSQITVATSPATPAGSSTRTHRLFRRRASSSATSAPAGPRSSPTRIGTSGSPRSPGT